jgi:peptide methionine sulfoxide reductase MsrB
MVSLRERAIAGARAEPCAVIMQPMCQLAETSHYQNALVSYAQNCEDVMLHRALRPVQQGFYVDVGANDPVCHSITKAFYECGWRGINIEPVQSWFGKIEADRSRDEVCRSSRRSYSCG